MRAFVFPVFIHATRISEQNLSQQVVLPQQETDADRSGVCVLPRSGPSKRALPGPEGALHHQAPLVGALLPEQARAGPGLREDAILLPFGCGNRTKEEYVYSAYCSRSRSNIILLVVTTDFHSKYSCIYTVSTKMASVSCFFKYYK